ncbi:MAG: DUF2628 domain-containing protein [Gallionellaceae bacterium]
MKKYQIFKHPDNRLDAVKEGFSFPGVIFGCFWLLWHKIWIAGIIAFVASIAVYFIFPNPEGYLFGVPYGHKFGLADIFNIGICLIIGFFGNEWRSTSLGLRGFKRVSTEEAETTDGAKAKYLLRDTSPSQHENHQFLK